MPQYALVYKLFLTGTESVTALRRAQRGFEGGASEKGFIDLHKSFILFSQEALIMDIGKGIRVQDHISSCQDKLTLGSSLLTVRSLSGTSRGHRTLTRRVLFRNGHHSYALKIQRNYLYKPSNIPLKV